MRDIWLRRFKKYEHCMYNRSGKFILILSKIKNALVRKPKNIRITSVETNQRTTWLYEFWTGRHWQKNIGNMQNLQCKLTLHLLLIWAMSKLSREMASLSRTRLYIVLKNKGHLKEKWTTWWFLWYKKKNCGHSVWHKTYTYLEFEI